MSGKTFAVVFGGKLVPGADPQQVRANLAKLFKTSEAKIAPLFSGKKVVLKKGIDKATAQKYFAALKKAGAMCQVIDVAAQAKAKQAESQPSSAPSPAAKADQAKAPPSIDATLAEPGAIIKEAEEVAPLDVDTSGMSMAEVGAQIGVEEEFQPLDVDVSDLSMAEVGAQIGVEEEVEELNIDVSELSMDEPGAVLKEEEEVEPPQIDTSKLSLS